MNFEDRVRQFICKENLIKPRELVLIGVSGGADSMSLLACLSALRHNLGIGLHAAHFNHRLRPGALRDERFVAAWCAKFNVPLTVGRREGNVSKHLSEDAARQMRFDFLTKTVQELHAQSIALAHTRNDLAETVLMRIMRGSGLYGLRSILPRRNIEGVDIVRPLLGLERRDVEDYLNSQKIPYCTDKTNTALKYARNKVRHKLIPLLNKEYNPQIVDALSGLAITAADDYDYLSGQARRIFESGSKISPQKVRMDLKVFRRRHPALVRLIFRFMAESLTRDPAVLTFEDIKVLERLSAQKQTGRADLPHDLKVLKSKNFLELYYA